MAEEERTEELLVVEVGKYKRIKQALAQSEERFKSLFLNIPIGIYRADPDGVVLDANPALMRMLGYSSFSEFSRLNLNDECSSDPERRREILRQLEGGGEIKWLEISWRRRDGAEILVRENVKAVRDAAGRILYVEGTLEDITEIKRQERLSLRRHRDLEVLNELIASGNRAPELAMLLDVILEVAVERLRFDGGAIYLPGDDESNLALRAGRHLDPGFRDEVERITLAGSTFGETLAGGTPQFVEEYPALSPERAARWGWRSMAALPLLAGGRVIGLLTLASRTLRPFPEEDRSLLQTIGREAGSLISRLQAESSLRVSEEGYRTLVETSPYGIMMVDLQGVILRTNQRMLELLGRGADEVTGRACFSFLMERDTPEARARFATNLVSGDFGSDEYEVLRPDGSTRHLEAGANLTREADDRPRSVIIYARDIGERLAAEHRLRDSEERFRITAEKTGQIIYDYDVASGRYVWAGAIESLTGYSPAEMARIDDLRWHQLVHPDDGLAIFPLLEKVAAEGSEFNINYRFACRDGTYIHVEDRGVYLRNEEGRVFRLLGTMNDVSERLRAAQALRDSEEMFRTTFEAIADPAYMWEQQPDGRILLTRANRAAYAITDGQIDRFIGVELWQLYRDRPEIGNIVAEVMAGGRSARTEMRYRFASTGKELWLLTDIVRTVERRALVVTKDITERKRSEERLLEYQEQLRALSSELTLVAERERRRVATELHDGVAQNLALCKLQLNELRGQWPGRVPRRWNEALKLLEQSIGETRSLVFDLSPPVLYELGLEAALDWLAERIRGRHNLSVQAGAAGVDPLPDETRVFAFQVVRELLVNVAKHARARHATVSLQRAGDRLRLEVADDGVGMEFSALPGLQAEGRGFGLFSMRERLRHSGGSMHIDSAPGRGTRVEVDIPLAPLRGA